MRDDSPDSEIREYYEQLSPSDDRIDAVFAMRDIVSESRRWKRVAIGSMVAATLMTAVCGFLLSRLANNDVGSVAEENVPQIEPPSDPETSPDGLVDTDTEEGAANDRLRLVAFRRHRDRCDQCRGISESILVLEQEFAGQPVEFVQLDFSDRTQLDETRRRSLDLGVGDILENGDHTGWLLTNSRGDLLAMLEPDSSREVVSAELNRLLQ